LKKPGIIFVGSFAHLSKSGHSGGMTKMCQYILDSEISNQVNWHLIDSTAPHNKYRSFLERFFPAIKRVLLFIWFLLTRRVDKVFVFAAQGFGFYEKGLMILIAKAFGKKTILAPRSGFLMKDINSSERFKNRALKIFKKSDIIVCQGSNWKSFLLDKLDLDERKIVIIPNGVVLRKQVHKEINPKRINFLFMGFVEKNKGIYDIVKSLLELEEDNWHLNIAGEGVALVDIKDIVINSNRNTNFSFHGWVTGNVKEQLLQNADVLLLPSYWEGMPNVILEAMARSTAVISSNVGAIQDMIIQGESGFIIEAGNIEQLTTAIKTYLLNPVQIQQHKEAGVLKIEKDFTIDRIIPKFAEILINN